jgi:hypothetical protein
VIEFSRDRTGLVSARRWHPTQVIEPGEEGAVVLSFRCTNLVPGTTWIQQAYVKGSNTGALDGFGAGVALSSNGAMLAVGAYVEASAATGIGGNQADNSAAGAGAIYVFE